MAGLFWKNRDYEVLVERLNRELIDDVIGTYVTIYRISPDQTEVNMYGESAISTGKVYDNGINVPSIITHEDLTFETNEFGPASDQVVTFAFQRNYLLSVDFRPEIGDIVEWNYAFFEINTINENLLVGGDTEKNHDIIATSHLTRLSKLNIDNQIRRGAHSGQ
tara:strand:+ start:984 stop:1475 length:492 start_codon:yes stop_codon:yes gene_type:complete